MMGKEPLVSIIVPAYNAASVLKRCLDSIVGQTYHHIEVVVVDDGSKDATGAIADEMAATDDRIRVIHKENGGVGAARNAALDVACGEWVTFVDADDYLEPDFIASLLAGEECDLMVGGYNTVGANEIPDMEYSMSIAHDEAEMRPLLEEHLTDMTFLCPWGKLFRMSIIKEYGLSFNCDMRIGEDVVLVWNYLTHCSSLALKPGRNYDYYTESADFKYASDEKTALSTIRRIFEPLDKLVAKTGMNPEKARCHILNYYIWLYKLYVKRNYGLKDISRLSGFFRNELISGYFKEYKGRSKDKMLVHLLLKMHLTVVLFLLIKLYY